MAGPKDEDFNYYVNFSFFVTNNVVKYKVLATRLDLAIRVSVKCLRVFMDSQPVARQLEGD